MLLDGRTEDVPERSLLSGDAPKDPRKLTLPQKPGETLRGLELIRTVVIPRSYCAGTLCTRQFSRNQTRTGTEHLQVHPLK